MKGRPSSFTDELAEEICARLAAGESLRSICRDDHMPDRATVANWCSRDEHFFSQYTRAREFGLDELADEVIEIADAGSGDAVRDRIRFDARRWYLSKLAPKRYGDKQEIEHKGNLTVTGLLDAAEQARKPPVADDG